MLSTDYLPATCRKVPLDVLRIQHQGNSQTSAGLYYKGDGGPKVLIGWLRGTGPDGAIEYCPRPPGDRIWNMLVDQHKQISGAPRPEAEAGLADWVFEELLLRGRLHEAVKAGGFVFRRNLPAEGFEASDYALDVMIPALGNGVLGAMKTASLRGDLAWEMRRWKSLGVTRLGQWVPAVRTYEAMARQLARAGKR